MKRLVALILVLGVLGWWALAHLERRLGLGRHAVSPQEVTLIPGRRAIVGGGRAVLGLLSRSRGQLLVELACADTRVRLELVEGRAGEEVCGVQVRPLGPDPRRRGTRFEVTWTTAPDA